MGFVNWLSDVQCAVCSLKQYYFQCISHADTPSTPLIQPHFFTFCVFWIILFILLTFVFFVIIIKNICLSAILTKRKMCLPVQNQSSNWLHCISYHETTEDFATNSQYRQLHILVDVIYPVDWGRNSHKPERKELTRFQSRVSTRLYLSRIRKLRAQYRYYITFSHSIFQTLHSATIITMLFSWRWSQYYTIVL